MKREDGRWRANKSWVHPYEWDQTVLYHELSGDLHILSPIAEAVWRRLEEGPAATAELVNRVRGELDLQWTADLEEQVVALFQEMDASGLIERTFP
ncbi:PqqD family protein, HPr-rel-A system [Desulfacinum hydrothermale DSM 13146]|uniref:PqqD family protein, HPr-rel-A system n=1 Tax=Desulfacinum hydrothermale DSM 13146 TaxID=1121390 RepID=A0A1W1XAV8_9BACT|nr:HPr-rel-A system PqqD family peptide chaperone [Desulfacinum hydrothermale]SMC20973.1 PqqD family protein, HPr-rel-A system [Desulfacinum hydrothermale DSM 13146]